MKAPLEQINFERIAERFDAYWRREEGTGPFVAIRCPREDRKPPDFAVPDTIGARWTDIEYQCNKALWQAENSLYLGDAFPAFEPTLGPDSFTAFLGGELTFLDEDTSWLKPFVDDLADWTPALDSGNKWWRLMCELLDAACSAAEGGFLVSIPDLHGGGDAMAAARHPDRLALDLYDRPGEVRRIMPILTGIYREVFDEYASRISRVQAGSTTWLPAYSRGRYTALQNDFSGLISPAMFAEFFLPEIEELAGWLDNSLYHLDGPSALGNLPHLLEVEALDGIQWEPGAGARPMSRWVDVCRQILEAGKCLQIGCASQVVEQMLWELPHNGFFITTGCATEGEARRLFERLQDYC